MISRRYRGCYKTLAATLFAVVAAFAQNPDTSGNGTVKGSYFVREVLMTGNVDGSVTAATSMIGVAIFDGNGNYTFTGQGTNLVSGPNMAVSLSGGYSVGSNGFFQMQSLADPTDIEFGGVSSLGPSAFVASATEQANVTMMVGIPIGSTVSNSSFKGNYTAGAIDFPNAGITAVRQAAFNLTADGAGNLGNVAISGAGANLGGTVLLQTDSGVKYSLSAGGSGTINFGAAAASQLVSGTKTFYISADGTIILGGSPTGYDMLIGIQALAGGASNAIANQVYYMGGLEDAIEQPTNAIDGFYGSESANGAGTSIFHNRINSLGSPVYDYTFDIAQYTIAPSGAVPATSGEPYTYTFGVNGQAFIGMGDVVDYGFYSLTLGLGLPKCAGGGVYLCGYGIVNLANFAPITNPIAPNELISLSGTGFTTSAVGASSLPLPMSLGNVTVTINGVPAPLDYVSPTQIIALVPSSVSPDNNAAYATIQVTSNNVQSNLVTVYTNNTAPGVFATAPAAVGAAAAQHGGGIAVTSSDPANIGEEIAVYVGGLGAVSPAVVPDGAAAPGPPNLSVAIDPGIDVDFGNPQAPIPVVFAGLTPTETGLYQVNVVIPVGTSSSSFFDVGTTDGYTSEAVLSVAGTTGFAEEKSVKPATEQVRRRRPAGKAQVKKAGLRARVHQPLP